MAELTVAANICGECGFSKESREHLEGRGLHGHISFSEEETAEQRAALSAGIAAAEAEMLAAEIASLEARLAALKGAAEAEKPAKPLARMNKSELLEVAESEGVSFSDSMTVKQLVAAIQAERDARAAAPVEPKEPAKNENTEDAGTQPEEPTQALKE